MVFENKLIDFLLKQTENNKKYSKTCRQCRRLSFLWKFVMYHTGSKVFYLNPIPMYNILSSYSVPFGVAGSLHSFVSFSLCPKT